MSTLKITSTYDNQPVFDRPLQEFLKQCKPGGAIQYLDPIEYITDQQRKWYKGILLPHLAKHDENRETAAWWDTEVKKLCNGLALLKKEIFFLDVTAGGRIPVGRLTTKHVGKTNMTAFIEEILSKSVQLNWGVTPPDKELRKQ